MIQTISRHK